MKKVGEKSAVASTVGLGCDVGLKKDFFIFYIFEKGERRLASLFQKSKEK